MPRHAKPRARCNVGPTADFRTETAQDEEPPEVELVGRHTTRQRPDHTIGHCDRQPVERRAGRPQSDAHGDGTVTIFATLQTTGLPQLARLLQRLETIGAIRNVKRFKGG